jgi:hypothetical protein
MELFSVRNEIIALEPLEELINLTGGGDLSFIQVILDAKICKEEKKETLGWSYAQWRRGFNQILRRRDARHQGGADAGSDISGDVGNSDGDSAHRSTGGRKCSGRLRPEAERTRPNDYKGH